MTIREALAAGKADLVAAGIDNPSLDTSLLLAEVLGISRSALVVAAADSGCSLGEAALAAFEGLVRRRAGGECVAYILGRKEFYGLEFIVNRDVLVPRPDTETLVETALECLSATGEKRTLRMLDLCTGSGAVAIATKHHMPGLEVWAADISPQALEVAEANAARLLPPGAIRFCRGDLFEALSGADCPPFDLITGNPPYVPAREIPSLSREVRTEPVLALDGGSDGLDVIRRIVSHALEFLCVSGTLMLEADPRQMGEIAQLLEQAGFTDVRIRPDLSGMERVILAIKSGASGNFS